MPNNSISIPPAVNATIYPSLGTFAFVVTANCTACFGTATPPGSFPDLENKTLPYTAGLTYRYAVPDEEGARITYNTSNPQTPCIVTDMPQTGKVIIVGSGMGSEPQTKSKSASKKAATKSPAKKAAKAKPAKTKARKAKPAVKKSKVAKKSKPKTKASPKPKTKSKATKKSKSRR